MIKVGQYSFYLAGNYILWYLLEFYIPCDKSGYQKNYKLAITQWLVDFI